MTVEDKDSVLQSTKKALGIASDYTAFDLDITMHINTSLGTLYQLGVGQLADQAVVEDGDTTWDQIWTTQANLQMIKTYIALDVKRVFDPPATGFTSDSIDRRLAELAWRISVATSTTPNTPPAETPGPVPGKPSIWDLTGLSDFPAEAPVGAFGIDLITRQLFEKS